MLHQSAWGPSGGPGEDSTGWLGQGKGGQAGDHGGRGGTGETRGSVGWANGTFLPAVAAAHDWHAPLQLVAPACGVDIVLEYGSLMVAACAEVWGREEGKEQRAEGEGEARGRGEGIVWEWCSSSSLQKHWTR